MIVLCKECQYETEYYETPQLTKGESHVWGYHCPNCRKDVTGEVIYVDDDIDVENLHEDDK
jgi:hypothetical protein